MRAHVLLVTVLAALCSLAATLESSALPTQPAVDPSRVVTSLRPSVISNDGNAVLQAELLGQACSRSASRTLYLVFSSASPTGQDVYIRGTLSADCLTVLFRVTPNLGFQDIGPGTYSVYVSPGRNQEPMVFAAGRDSKGAELTAPTVPVSVVDAAVVRVLGQTADVSSSRLTVTLSVGLEGEPTILPATVSLRISDPTVDVLPAAVTWRPGELGTKRFVLHLHQAPGPSDPALVAEAVPVSNLFLASSASSRLTIDVPAPAFEVVGGEVVYRSRFCTPGAGSGGGGNSSSGAAGAGGNSSSPANGTACPNGEGPGSVKLTVRRVGPSPFASTLAYAATLLQALGCPNVTLCASAMRGAGTVTFSPYQESASVDVAIAWAAVPYSAILSFGLVLTPRSNAAVAASSQPNATALYVFGTTAGTCPAGTAGPWVAPASSASGGAASGVPPPAPAPPPAPLLPDDSAASFEELKLLDAVEDYHTAEALPVIAGFSSGDVSVVLPTAAPAAALDSNQTDAMPPSPAPSPSPPSPPPDGTAAQPPRAPVELRLPFGLGSARVFLPLDSADQTVVTLNTTCGQSPVWSVAAAAAPQFGSAPPPPAAPNATRTGNDTKAAPTSQRQRAWASWLLPPLVGPCTVLVGVYSTALQPQPQGSSLSAIAPGNGTQAPAPSTAPPVAWSLPSPAPTAHPAPAPSDTTAARTPTPSAGPAQPTPSPAAANSSVNASSSAAGNSSSPSSAPSPSPSVSVFGMLQVRTLNITVLPLSDPSVFTRMALALEHEPSGRSLPLCGAPQKLLAAAAQLAYGAAFNSASPDAAQLALAAATLARAIRGSPDAVLSLQPSAGGTNATSNGTNAASNSTGPAQGSTQARRRTAQAFDAPLRLLARVARESARALEAAAAAASSLAQVVARRGAASAQAGDATWTTRRRLAQAGSSPPVLLPSPAVALPSPAPTDAPAPQPAPAPSPVRDGSGGWQGYGGDAGTPATAPGAGATTPDGFTMQDGTGGAVHVLHNPQYVEWCDPAEAQAVDLMLLRGDGAMALVARSGGAELPQAGPPFVVDFATRARVAAAHAAAGAAAAAAAAAASPPAVPGGGGGALQMQVGPSGGSEGASARLSFQPSSDGDLKSDTPGQPRSTDVSPSAPPPAPLPSPPAPLPSPPAPLPSPPAPLPSPAPAYAPPSQPAASSGNSSSPGICSPGFLNTLADEHASVTVIAPDGVSTTVALLALYDDYGAAAAASRAAAAAHCGARGAAPNATAGGNATAAERSSSPGSSPGLGSSTQPPLPAPAPLTAALEGASEGLVSVQLRSLPLLVSPLTACRPCKPGNYSTAANASSCLQCAPGSYAPDVVNVGCTPCPLGTFTFAWGSNACRLCPAGSAAPRPGSTSCTVCTMGTTSLTDGASTCVAPPPPPSGSSGSSGSFAMVVSFQMVLNMTEQGGLNSVDASKTGIDGTPDQIIALLIAADTAEALRIPPTQVRVSSLQEISPSTFLVNVSATVPLGQTAGGGSGGSAPGSGAASPSKDVDADTLIGRLVNDPKSSFPRTSEATGSSVQVQHVDRQVIPVGGSRGGVNPHVIVWPTLAGTAVLAVIVGFACGRYCRRRRRQGGGLPPLSDALGRLWPKDPGSPPPAIVVGQLVALELQDVASTSLAARHRTRGSKPNLQGMGMAAQDVDADLAIYSMYYREAMVGPRI